MEITDQARRRYWLAKLERDGLKKLKLDKATEAKVKQAIATARAELAKEGGSVVSQGR